MKYTAVRVPNSLKKKNRKEFDRTKRLFIKWCAYKGLLSYLPPKELEMAMSGHLSDKYSIHHIKPLSTCMRPNRFENLMIIDKTTHKFIHKGIDKQLEGFHDMPVGYKKEITVPSVGDILKFAIHIKQKANSK